jgi:sugar/nucleoside kinase (ribokinase family)
MQGLRVDFLLPDIHEGRALTGAVEAKEVLETPCELFPAALIALKLGPEATLIFEWGCVFHIESTAHAAMDATGTADFFGGAFLGNYLRSRDVEVAGRRAVLVAGWVVACFGTRAPVDGELRRRLETYGPLIPPSKG